MKTLHTKTYGIQQNVAKGKFVAINADIEETRKISNQQTNFTT